MLPRQLPHVRMRGMGAGNAVRFTQSCRDAHLLQISMTCVFASLVWLQHPGSAVPALEAALLSTRGTQGVLRPPCRHRSTSDCPPIWAEGLCSTQRRWPSLSHVHVRGPTSTYVSLSGLCAPISRAQPPSAQVQHHAVAVTTTSWCRAYMRDRVTHTQTIAVRACHFLRIAKTA